ncbi:MAG TPA: Gfo/Idh/MocA family oxidoreductase [Verrucomicrobiae bacterium]|jgi:predicted dehydrogenase
MNKFRWGILSTAGIARKNWRAIRDSGNSIVTAVASRDAARGREFIDHCQREMPAEFSPAALGSYEALIESKDVDGIYIPLPTGLRKEWVLRAAAAGRHVLCEKPCGLSAADVREMTEACRKHRVQFMDGVMFMHNLRMSRLREILDDQKMMGPIRNMMSVFSFAGTDAFYKDNIRIHSELEPAGSLGDLGWYCLRFALWAMNWRLPREATGRILSAHGSRLSPAASPTDFSGELIFEGGVSMGFYCSFRAQFQNWVTMGGALGCLRVADFVHPTSIHEPSFELNGAAERVKICDCEGPHSASRAPGQDSRMFRNFAGQAASGKLNEEWPGWAVKTQQVMDACLQSARRGGSAVHIE